MLIDSETRMWHSRLWIEVWKPGYLFNIMLMKNSRFLLFWNRFKGAVWVQNWSTKVSSMTGRIWDTCHPALCTCLLCRTGICNFVLNVFAPKRFLKARIVFYWNLYFPQVAEFLMCCTYSVCTCWMNNWNWITPPYNHYGGTQGSLPPLSVTQNPSGPESGGGWKHFQSLTIQ